MSVLSKGNRGLFSWVVSACFTACLVVTSCPSAALAMQTYTAHGGPVKGLAIAPDNSAMVSASFDYTVVVWSTDQIAPRATLFGHEAAVNVAAFSPDSTLLATAGDDGLILLWDMADIAANKDDAEPMILSGHKGKVVGLSFAPNGSQLASASWDGSIGLWQMQGNERPLLDRFITGHDGPVNMVRFSHDMKHLYSAGYDGSIRRWLMATGEYQRSLVRNGWGVSVFEIDEERDMLAYGTADGGMYVVRFSDQTELLRFGDERVPVLSLHYNAADNMIGFGTAKGRIMLADTRDWSIFREFRAANGPVWSMLVMPKGDTLVIGSLDDHITEWSIFEFPPEFLESPGKPRRFHPTVAMTNGEKQFARKCSVCHTLEKDGKRRAGPTLFGVFGREAGTLDGYHYSEALLTSQIVWDETTISRLFDEGPDVVTPGTKMPIQRMKDPQDRRDLVTFLKMATTPAD
jgi:cytochrome c